ncbi:tripartite tricarboxylate transporter substrate binding protein [Bordetella sp. BOR01]|uniref:Bug family tripartite tricarboxylate transporter substrate binding protein n=1 Tax=Bordetella sp. BOR01 TaxID=2854779 RepID=UPI001C476391|nr:tripartite tricarboxylate transporter substrate binding protein [Bordetella sp. BOR01]MBV7483696.1 tripartite tricarboxylate transporter substrate binding protein [Bordetella sp. BOR01]
MNLFFSSSVRRRLSAALLAAGVCGGAPALAAQDYPARPLTMVVPFSAGATADTLGRMIAREMQDELGQTVVVENRAGGGSTIGAAAVARSAPDGYTLLLGSGSTHTVAPVVIKDMKYDPVKDFQPIALIGTTSYVVLVNADSPMRTLADLVEYGKTHPQKLSYGSTGVGGAVHLATVMLQNQTGASFLHVPYRGGAPAIADLLGGQIDFTLGTAEAAGMVSQGKLRALAVLGPDRLQALPDVPTCNETGVPDCTFPVWNAIFAPAGTPAPVVAKLTAAVEHALAEPQTVTRLRELGYQPATGGAEALGKRVVEESVFMHKTAAAAGVQPQ